jgi:hypothetical protein
MDPVGTVLRTVVSVAKPESIEGIESAELKVEVAIEGRTG